MPTAALPRYLGDDFKGASPGMRFGMCFKLWGIDNRSGKLLWTTHDQNYRTVGKDHSERLFKDENKTDALKEATRFNPSDCDVMEKLAFRQRCLTEALPATGASLCTFFAASVSPFTTGLGNEHPLENGFSFLNPYGLPYLPGSGVKGVVRQAARELASGQWGEAQGWFEDVKYVVPETKTSLSMIDVLFGREPPPGDKHHFRGALSFWDVIPQIEGERLAVEIMTPHQTHYYAKGDSPHDSGSPNPIPFLTVPPGSSFAFHVTCDRGHLERVAPDLAENDHCKKLLQSAFTHAFDWLGFGAKTAVGYGQMKADQEAIERQETERKEKAKREAERREQERREQEWKNLPEDAAWVERRRSSNEWSNVNRFLDDLDEFLKNSQELSNEAYERLAEELMSRWSGILNDPDATRGKKKKPKYNPRPRALAKKLITLKPD